MTSIIIAGRPNSEEMSECILVAENISDMYPSSRFTFVLKHPKEWEVYCEDICNLFGIVRKTYPLILFSNGKQIGGQKEFFKLIKETFNCEILIKEGEEITLQMNREVIDNLTKENSVLVEKEYICRTRGMPIIDKINESLNKIPIEHYDTLYSKYNTLENDYNQGFIKDMKVFVKFDKKYTPIEEEYKEEEDVILSDTLKMETEFYVKKKEEEEMRLKMLTEPNKISLKDDIGKDQQEQGQEGVGVTEENNAEGGVNGNLLQQQQQETEKSKNKSSHSTKENAPSVIPEAIKNASQPTELTFHYYTNLDIPIFTYDIEICIENVKEGDYDLIMNPSFTFYGETMLNFNKEYVPPKIEGKANLTHETINNDNEENVVEVNNEQREGEGQEQGEEGEQKEEEGQDVEHKDEEVGDSNPDAEVQQKEEQDTNQIEDKMREEELKSTEKVQDLKGKQDNKALDVKPEAKVQVEENEAGEDEEATVTIVQKILDPVYGVIPQIPSSPDDKPTLYNPLINLSKYPEELIVIKDYGRLPSFRIIQYDEDLPFYESKLPPYQILSQVGNSMNIFDYSYNLLNEKDLFALISAVNETKSFACLRILPYKYADWKTFGSNKIKIIPKQPVDLKHEDFPLKLKVDQEIQSIKRNLFNEIKKTQVKTSFASILHNSEFSSCFKLPNIIKIALFESLGIKHLVKYFPDEQFNVTNVKQALGKMMKELEIDNVTGNGYNLICCQEFLFLAPLVSPYAYTKSNIPLFAEPHFFMGVFTLPIIEAEWPESVKGKMIEFDLAEILIKSTN